MTATCYRKTERVYVSCERSAARGKQDFHQTVYRCIHCGAAVCINHQPEHVCGKGQ